MPLIGVLITFGLLAAVLAAAKSSPPAPSPPPPPPPSPPGPGPKPSPPTPAPCTPGALTALKPALYRNVGIGYSSDGCQFYWDVYADPSIPIAERKGHEATYLDAQARAQAYVDNALPPAPPQPACASGPWQDMGQYVYKNRIIYFAFNGCEWRAKTPSGALPDLFPNTFDGTTKSDVFSQVTQYIDQHPWQ